MKNKLLSVAALALVVLCTGCVSSIRRDFSPTVARSSGLAERSVGFDFARSSYGSFGGGFNKDKRDLLFRTSAWVAPQDDQVALRQFREAFAGRASSLNLAANGCDDADIRLKIHLQNSWNTLAMIPAMVCGCTLTFCPCWGDDTYTLYVEAESKKGLRKTYRIEGAVKTTCWLPCIIPMPFDGFSSKKVDELTADEWRELRTRMENDGFFD